MPSHLMLTHILKCVFSVLFQVNKLIPDTIGFPLPEVKCIVVLSTSDVNFVVYKQQ